MQNWLFFSHRTSCVMGHFLGVFSSVLQQSPSSCACLKYTAESICSHRIQFEGVVLSVLFQICLPFITVKRLLIIVLKRVSCILHRLLLVYDFFGICMHFINDHQINLC